MAKLTKAAIKAFMVKRGKSVKPKERGIFDDVTASDVLCGFNNKVNTKREARTNANGLRWTVNKLRFG